MCLLDMILFDATDQRTKQDSAWDVIKHYELANSVEAPVLSPRKKTNRCLDSVQRRRFFEGMKRFISVTRVDVERL